MKKKVYKQFLLRLDEDLKKFVERQAMADDISASEYIRRLLKDKRRHVKSQPKRYVLD